MGAKGSDLVNNDPIALAVRFGFLVLVFWFWFRFFFSFLFFSPRDDHHESFHVIAYEPILSIHVSVR